MRILSCVPFPIGPMTPPGFQVDTCEPREIVDHLQGVDVLVPGNNGVVDRSLLDRGSFGLVLQVGMGLDKVDVEAATDRGVWVAHIPSDLSGNAVSVAEHAVFLALAVSRRLHEAEAALAARKVGQPLGLSLKGKTACIIGLGNVGAQLARRLQAFDMTLIGVNPRPVQIDGVILKALHTTDRLAAALAGADFVFVCASGDKKNVGLIDRRILAAMKRGAVLVNVARGQLVDEAALLDALQSRQLAGAGLDVFTDEPIDPAAPLLRQPTVVATPHVGGATDLTLAGTSGMIRSDLDAYFRHERFPGLVNHPAHARCPLN